MTIRPFRHIGLQLLSLGLGVSLWMVVSGEETVERGLRVPLEFQQFPAGLELQGEPPSNVDVRVRGASGTLARVSPGDIVAVLDLRGAREGGGRLFHLTSDQVRAPFGVEVVQITPANIVMTFEPSRTRNVKIRPRIEGSPAPGFVIGQVTVDPDSVDVAGAASAVNRASEALTEPLSVVDARETVSGIVTVGLIDPTLRLKSTRAARVTVEIIKAPLERTLRDLPVHLRHLAAGLTAEAVPSVVGVSLRGSREALNRVAADDVTAYIDLAGLGAGQYPLPVRADASRDAGVTHIEPALVQVRIASAKD